MKRVHLNTLCIFVWVICSLFFFCRFSIAEELIATDQALKQVFPKALAFDKKIVALSEEQIRRIEETAGVIFSEGHSVKVIAYSVKEGAQVGGYALEDTVKGKWGGIHYLVALTLEGNVVEVVILDYKEIRGKPIAKRRFLRQYLGKTAQDPLQVRKDIDGVTGATISSRSLTEGVRKLLDAFQLIKSDLDKVGEENAALTNIFDKG